MRSDDSNLVLKKRLSTSAGSDAEGGRPVFRNYGIGLKERQERTMHPLGEEYLYKLAGLLHADVYLPPEKDPFAMTVKRRTSTGWEAISIDEVVAVQDDMARPDP